MQDQVLTLTITAVDPVAFALTWLLAWVAKSPAVEAALCEELACAGRRSRPARLSLDLPYLDGDLPGSIADSPDLAHGRGQAVDGAIGDSGVSRSKPGINVAPCAYLVHRREDLYPDPLSFRPERFLSRQYSPYEYFPFGGSNRHCLGTTLVAPMEMKLVLAMVLSQGRMILENSGQVRTSGTEPWSRQTRH